MKSTCERVAYAAALRAGSNFVECDEAFMKLVHMPKLKELMALAFEKAEERHYTLEDYLVGFPQAKQCCLRAAFVQAEETGMKFHYEAFPKIEKQSGTTDFEFDHQNHQIIVTSTGAKNR
jgi:hypothetical protein